MRNSLFQNLYFLHVQSSLIINQHYLDGSVVPVFTWFSGGLNGSLMSQQTKVYR